MKKQLYLPKTALHGLFACAAAFAAWAQLELSCNVPAAFWLRQLPWTVLNAAFVLGVTLLLTAALGRRAWGMLAGGTLFTVLAAVNYYARDLHGTAVMPQDVLNVGTAAEVLGTYTLHITPTVWAILGLYLVVLALVWAQFRVEKKGVKPHRPLCAAAGLVTLAALFALLPAPQNGWHWQDYYYTHGYLMGTIQATRLLADPVVCPAGYSDDAVTAPAVQTVVQDTPDVLVILSESFYDLSLVTDLRADADFLENWNALPGAVRGHAVSPHVGGGTNTSEYTLLTSNSPLLLPAITPFNSLDMTDANSLASYFGALGYATMAAHPYTAGNYRRDTAWAAMGFDETHFGGDFPTEAVYGARPYQTDAATYADFLALYQRMPADQPRFAFLVTIQNHGDYDMNDAALDTVHAAAEYGFYDSVVDEYLSCLKLTDEALPRLTGALTELYQTTGRKVLLLMVGDHAPSFVDHIADKTGRDYQELLTLERSTPYLLWANWRELTPPEQQTVDLTALAPLALQTAGLPLTPYYRAALDAQASAPLYAGVCDDDAQRAYFLLEYNNIGSGAERRQALFTLSDR